MILLLSIFLGGVILALTHAIYQPDCVILTAGALVSCVLAGRAKSSTLQLDPGNPVERAAPLAVAVMFALLLSRDHELLYAKDFLALAWLKSLTLASGLLALVAATAAVGQPHRALRPVTMTLVAAGACLVSARFLVPLASPEPFIDVFWINTWAVRDFLAGKNPYSQIYPDIYQGAYGYQPGFTYWPAYLLAATVPGALHLDLRYLNIIADLAFAGLIGWRATRSKATKDIAAPMVFLWLAMPVSLFIIEQAWVDSVMLALAAGAAVAFGEKRVYLAATLAGTAAATKQYGFIVPGILAAAVFGGSGWKQGIRFCAAAAVAGCAFLLPFVAWDVRAIYANTVQLLMTIPVRKDSLTIPALLINNFGWEIPGGLLLSAYLAVFLACLWTALRRPAVSAVLFASALCYGFLFVMGKQASANYYALVLGLGVLGIIYATQEARGRG